MKLSPILLAVTTIPTAVADFWLVYQRRYAQFGRAEVTSFGASFHGPLWHDPLVTVEINLESSDLGRQTIFSSSDTDSDFTMVDDDNEVTGLCFEDRTFILDLDCWYRHPDPRVVQYHVNINGSSMFFYESDIEVDQIRNGEDTLQRVDWEAGFWIG
ncbi:hypothetical protein F4861DRAFT_543219 [Xylaria intraflava]|nr:hypothetical protein F4861DRAFT_543219 [Xylaria intraflava]